MINPKGISNEDKYIITTRNDEERNLLTAEYYANLGTDHQIPLPSNLPEYPTTEDILLMAEVINRHLGL